jgi:predicted acetyltransferase
MSFEIRPITNDEVEQAEAIIAYSFNNPERRDLAPAAERARRFFPTEWSLASFEDGEMTAFVRTVPMAMRINGHGLSFGAVGPVVSMPQHRRKGHVGAVLKRALEVMRERGQVLSGLHTPHPSLYRRYGWEIASVRRVYSFAPKDISLAAQPEERGRVRMLQPDDWPQADRVYRLHAAKRNGPVHRGDVWWREAIFGASGPNHADVALWENGTGEPQGYVVYHQGARAGDDWPPPFWVRELVAISRDAYLNLISYLTRHDLPREIVWNAPPDDPFRLAISDASRINVREEYDVMLRIADVEAALRLRPPSDVERSLDLTMRVTDTSAPWNDGTWRLAAAGGQMEVERVEQDADITLSATTLAPVFNGYLSPTQGALAGLVGARDDDALATADAMFAVLHPPFCADGF